MPSRASRACSLDLVQRGAAVGGGVGHGVGADLLVECGVVVDEGHAEVVGHLLPDRRLARAHGPDECDVPAEAHRCAASRVVGTAATLRLGEARLPSVRRPRTGAGPRLSGVDTSAYRHQEAITLDRPAAFKAYAEGT